MSTPRPPDPAPRPQCTLLTARVARRYDEVVAVRDNLRRQGVEVDNDYIRETWKPLYLR